MLTRKIETTADGSKTLFIPELDEHYHSTHGAKQEALHVFIKHGLDYCGSKKKLTILEIGFGTGLNAFLTCLHKPVNQEITYVSLEAHPISLELAQQMNYPELHDTSQQDIFKRLHESKWNETCLIDDHFSLKKVHKTIQEWSFSPESVDLIYYDAFGPRAQEEMWNTALFSKMFNALKPSGILVTYCAKGQVKRDFKAVGFEVEPLPGPPGKREMTRCHKK